MNLLMFLLGVIVGWICDLLLLRWVLKGME